MTLDFSSVARPYRFLEYGAFGPFLWWCRVAFLDHLGGAERVLMAGEGDGRFLAAYLHRFPDAGIDYIDASPGMAALARERAGDSPRVQIRTGLLPAHPLPPGAYDLLCTHFFLDCFPPGELPAVVDALARAAAPSARWVVSEFRIPPGRLAATGSRILVAGLYLFFRWTAGLRARRLTPHGPLLAAAGFRLLEQRHRLGGLLTSELWSRQPD